MQTVNILGRLRLATEQVRQIQFNLVKDQNKHEQIEVLANVGKELDGILYNLVDVFSDDTRHSEINITSHDEQISKWLEQTFSSKQQRTLQSTSRFHSIKVIIQASSFVNALQRQLRQHIKERLAILDQLTIDINQLNLWSFSIMNYSEPILVTLLLIFDAHDIIERYRIDVDRLKNFACACTEGYRKFQAVYHNDYHGADVLQTTHCLLIKSHLSNMFTPIEITALLFAAVVHDYEHPGLNNNYLVKTQSDLALLYNDSSILENHHSSAIFILLRDKNLNIWSNMTLDEYRTFRSLVISLVLATDMANHATLVERMSTYFYLKEMNSTATTTDSKTFLQIVLHAADISNAAKPWPIYIEFAEKIMEEFFLQGDLERVHCTDDKPTFDRETTNVAQLQIGFITHIVSPIFDVLSKVLQMDSFDLTNRFFLLKSSSNNVPWQDDLRLNLEIWRLISKQADEEQIVLSKKPLKLNFSYLQMFANKTRHSMKKRSQHDILLHRRAS